MNADWEMIIGVIISGPGTLINLICFAFSGLELGFIGNMIYLAMPFIIGFLLILHSWKWIGAKQESHNRIGKN